MPDTNIWADIPSERETVPLVLISKVLDESCLHCTYLLVSKLCLFTSCSLCSLVHFECTEEICAVCLYSIGICTLHWIVLTGGRRRAEVETGGAMTTSTCPNLTPLPKEESIRQREIKFTLLVLSPTQTGQIQPKKALKVLNRNRLLSRHKSSLTKMSTKLLHHQIWI